VPRTTMADVATAAGVSTMTVSNVLNGRGGASAETQRRVLDAVRELGYVPSASARQLRSGRSKLVGLHLDDLTRAERLTLMRGAAIELRRGGRAMLAGAGDGAGDDDEHGVDALVAAGVDALILVSPTLTDRLVTSLELSRHPVVVALPTEESCPFPHVTVDVYGGVRAATERTIALGHRRLLLLGSDDPAAAHRAAFTDAVTLAGIDEGALVVECADDYAQALNTVREHLDSHAPTAIIAASDVRAFAAIDAARLRGLTVPDDLSVVGFGDVPQAANSFPALTTVREPLADVGRAVARIALGLLDDIEPVQHRLALQTDLIERDTLAPPPG
jgi:LacI family transcriptional regulator